MYWILQQDIQGNIHKVQTRLVCGLMTVLSLPEYPDFTSQLVKYLYAKSYLFMFVLFMFYGMLESEQNLVYLVKIEFRN